MVVNTSLIIYKNIFSTNYKSIIKSDSYMNFGLEPKKMESVVLVHHDEVYLKSRAVLKIVELLPFGFHKVLLIGRILPLKWTDKMYDGVAYIRYRIFGKKATCTVPDEQVRHRYI